MTHTELVERLLSRLNGQNPSWQVWIPYGEISEAAASLRKLEAEVTAIRSAIAPVMDWYQSDEDHARPLAEIVSDAVEDLQVDRAEALKSRKLEAENKRLREALEWYGEQARRRRHFYLFHDYQEEQDTLHHDGGQRARTALGGDDDR